MAKRSVLVLISIGIIAAALAAVFIGLSIYSASPASYDRVLAQFLKAEAAGDAATVRALTSEGFVNELASVRLKQGEFRAYDFGQEGSPASETRVLRFAVVVLAGEGEAAYMAEAVFKTKGPKHVLTSIKRTSTGKPILE